MASAKDTCDSEEDSACGGDSQEKPLIYSHPSTTLRGAANVIRSSAQPTPKREEIQDWPKQTLCGLKNRFENWRKIRSQRRVSDTIDKRLKEEKKCYREVRPILVVGTKQSGKSTVVKQICSLASPYFGDLESRLGVVNVRKNLLDSILSIASAMPVTLKRPENQAKLEYLQNFRPRFNYDYTDKFFEHVEALWEDEGVQAAFERRDQYRLKDNAKYFLDRIEIIKQHDYIPSEKDVLCSYQPTKGPSTHYININGTHFCINEIGEMNSSINKWIHCFDDILALIFVIDCNCLVASKKNVGQNLLQESLDLFATFWENTFLRLHIPFYLFFNKRDLLTEKNVDDKIKLENYSSKFASYRLKTQTDNSQADLCIADFRLPLYHQFTCAIDGEGIKHAFTHLASRIEELRNHKCELI